MMTLAQALAVEDNFHEHLIDAIERASRAGWRIEFAPRDLVRGYTVKLTRPGSPDVTMTRRELTDAMAHALHIVGAE